ncbi:MULTISPECIES: CotH kinase family protein [unclassified Fibrobacter]|uniref:CotH kinase family protein n=1 Tax=unclassified Fibrobacter TaxID=2634177 RepID=UPI000D6B3BBF|nr:MULTISPECIES: CotH kinase family protein [unclassified Fibrobacter]PWJ58615.1 CotH protein [Fibrobacter sp. UWR4]PZW62843.1 CotH protein [Fibrobacter sp. UWR1]
MRFCPILPILFSLVLNACVWDNGESPDNYLPLDDSAFPFSGIPRLVIETESGRQIRDRETLIPAKLQIYGDRGPQGEILELNIRGRGNSSFTGMPKWGMKLKFNKKQSLLGMPKDKEWALIANSADKTLLKNFITYKLASWLGDEYSPRAEFVELYLNRQYLGVYLLSETVKVSSDRVSLTEGDFSYLLELGSTPKENDINIFSSYNTKFTIKYPKEPSDSSKQFVTRHINNWEYYLRDSKYRTEKPIDDWIDMEDFMRYYWIQEFSKNLDGAFRRSIYITWEKGDKIKYGPVWDFDVAYGNWTADSLRTATDWYVRPSGWNGLIFNNSLVWNRAKDYWKKNLPVFQSINDSLDYYAQILKEPSSNEFKRWPVLENTENWTYKEAYSSHQEAVDSLKSWISQRIDWINNQIQ